MFVNHYAPAATKSLEAILCIKVNVTKSSFDRVFTRGIFTQDIKINVSLSHGSKAKQVDNNIIRTDRY